MGLTKAETSPGLSFDFDNPRQHYSPGDAICGRIVLNTAADSAIGRVTLSFWGRAKSRIIQQHGQAVTYHRGRTQLFKLEQVLYESQYTQKPGMFSWPFEIVVPELADPECVMSGEKWKPKDHFRSNVDEGSLDLTLPPSTYHSRRMFGRQAECYIEYVLEATLTEPEGLHHIRKPQTKVSTHPITFHPLSTPEPIQNYNFAADQRLITISTLKLLPEHAGTSLGFRDRARSLFQRDTIPKFSFRVGVQTPSIIQLFHPNPIPFLITATPDLSPELTTVDTSTSLPKVILRSAKIELKTQVRCRAPGTFNDSKTYEIPILASKILNQPLQLVNGLTTASEAVLDLGTLCDLRLGNAKLGSRLETPLCPNFNTFNVARTYQLTWELELECAERIEKFSSVKNGPECTVILPPATVVLDSPQDPSMLGGGLMQAVSSQSTGSSTGFWSRGSSDGRSGSKKEKPGFGPPTATNIGTATTVSLGGGDGKGRPDGAAPTRPSKAEEAAEDRARARLLEVQSGYQHGFDNPFSLEPSDGVVDTPGAPTANSRQHGVGTTGTSADADLDNQLPKYVP